MAAQDLIVKEVNYVPSAYTNGNTVTIHKQAQYERIVAMSCEIQTAFNGTTPTLKAGDGTTTDLYMLTADITAGTPGLYPGKGTATTGMAAMGGILATAAAGKDVVVTFGSGGSPTAGAAKFTITYYRERG
ncbi:MAG: hypothetical protein U0821_18620 [Chloroflexota bacterium]